MKLAVVTVGVVRVLLVEVNGQVETVQHFRRHRPEAEHGEPQLGVVHLPRRPWLFDARHRFQAATHFQHLCRDIFHSLVHWRPSWFSKEIVLYVVIMLQYISGCAGHVLSFLLLNLYANRTLLKTCMLQFIYRSRLSLDCDNWSWTKY